MTPDESQFSDKTPLEHPITIYTTDGTPMPISHKGTISSPCLSLSDTFHIPKLSLNLLFVGQLCELGIDLLFTNHGVDVQDPRMGQVLGTGCKVGRMFEVHDLKIPLQVVSTAATTTIPSPDLWHAHLGHPSLSHLQLLVSQGYLGSVQFQNFDCTSYHFGKQTKLPFNNKDSFSSTPFDLLNSDIWGPAPVPIEGGSRYFVIFVDDFSRYTWIYLLHHRSELVSIYQTFHKMIETQFNLTIKVFRSNNAQKYNDKSLLSFLGNHGTLTQRSCPYISQQNGRAKRKHRHILDVVHILLISTSLPECFWGKAALTAIYTIIVFLHQLHTKNHHLSFSMVKPMTTPFFKFLVVLALSFFLLMNEQSSSLVLVSVVSLVKVYLKRGFAIMIPFSSSSCLPSC